ncbi:hypothetical protein C8R44DRAFT_754730 [Mycena epipterygia]|nr:hypothetical protein C8R44DRAFT_754730 [Mycena epipterygia]
MNLNASALESGIELGRMRKRMDEPRNVNMAGRWMLGRGLRWEEFEFRRIKLEGVRELLKRRSNISLPARMRLNSNTGNSNPNPRIEVEEILQSSREELNNETGRRWEFTKESTIEPGNTQAKLSQLPFRCMGHTGLGTLESDPGFDVYSLGPGRICGENWQEVAIERNFQSDVAVKSKPESVIADGD